MNQFLARQPIFDRNMNVYGYELLYRSDGEHNSAGALTDPDRATSELMVTGFHNIGVEKLTGGKRAFVNFTENLLREKVATLFSNRYLVVEILETVRESPKIIEACQQLKHDGYLLALDDFVYAEENRRLLGLADIVKVDWLLPDVEENARRARNGNARLLAEKVETEEAFERARALGFSLFQGYFFSKPTILAQKKVDPMAAHYLQLVRLVNQEEVDFISLSKLIRRDVVLSYRLLRLVNSVYFGMQYQVSDIQNALAILGLAEIRKWICMLAMMGICAGKTDELVRVSMIRGRVMELYGCKYLGMKDAGHLFMTGLFSLIDVLLDLPMADALSQTSIADEVSAVLLGAPGPAVDMLRLLEAHERAAWSEAEKQAVVLGLSEEVFSKLYVDAVVWSSSFSM
ncbi:MAG: HDOD domain-containing protein [Oscillospiraceae bacterium]|nr:HDOD domain-containing protein [Oscillospiraceae bacterium]